MRPVPPVTNNFTLADYCLSRFKPRDWRPVIVDARENNVLDGGCIIREDRAGHDFLF
jgi:hypothetical protein